LSINIVMTITDQTRLAFQPYASKFFLDDSAGAPGAGPLSLLKTPRYKFMYYASFVLDQTVLDSISSEADPAIVKNLRLDGWQDKRSISFLVKKVDRPKIDLTTVESNQYNLRRQNYTRVAFTDVTMTLYDTSDNRVLNMWINYFRYYFNNSRAGVADITSLTPTGPSTGLRFDEFQSGYGMAPVYGRNFFKEIGLYAIFGQKAQLTRLISPRISRIDWGTFDSTDSGPTEVTISFKYENIIYSEDVDLKTNADLADSMGFIGNPLDPPNVPITDDAALSRIPKVDFDTRVQAVVPRPALPYRQVREITGPVDQTPQSIYVPFLGAVGGAVNISPVISPFGILVFGL